MGEVLVLCDYFDLLVCEFIVNIKHKNVGSIAGAGYSLSYRNTDLHVILVENAYRFRSGICWRKSLGNNFLLRRMKKIKFIS